MIAMSLFDAAHSYEAFLAAHGTEADKTRWDRSRDNVPLSEAQQALLGVFLRKTNILVLAGAWCGDCSFQVPILQKFADLNPKLEVRLLDRDVHADLQKELTINGGNRVPVAIFFSEDGHEVARFGERTISAYRRRIAEELPALRPHVNAVLPADDRAACIAEWLQEVERVQWILRLSPRLRRLHGD